MKTHVLLILAILIFTACKKERGEGDIPIVSKGSIERIENFESQYVTSRNIDIWLPDNYPSAGKYAVLYMHDGQMLYDAAVTWNKQEWGVDEVVSELIGSGKIEPCIVVGIWNGGPTRHPDYFPQKPFEALPKAYRDSLIESAKRDENTALFKGSVKSDNYLKFLVEEVKPFIDGKYETHTDAGHTFVAGSSMGGLISMYAICEYPEVFSAAACISTHWPGIMPHEGNPIPAFFQNYLQQTLPDPGTHRIYFDYGTETLDAYYEPHQLAVDSVMREKGWNESNWMTQKFEGEEHSERSWRKRLDIPLEFIMSSSE